MILSGQRFTWPSSEKLVGKSAELFTSTTIDWQIKRSPADLIPHHKITALLTPLLHARWVMVNQAISI